MSAIIVRRENHGFIWKREQLARDRIVLSARVAAREIGASGSVDEQYVTGEDAILREQANRIRRVARSMEDAQFFTALQQLTVFDVDTDVWRRRQTMHRDGRIGQRAQLHRTAAMIGMRVSVDDQVETQSVITEDRQVSFDLVADWIDDGGLAGIFCYRQVSLALAMIQFA